jgi:hypothetical protein
MMPHACKHPAERRGESQHTSRPELSSREQEEILAKSFSCSSLGLSSPPGLEARFLFLHEEQIEI